MKASCSTTLTPTPVPNTHAHNNGTHTQHAPQACKFLPGSDLIVMEASEAVDKLRLLLRILGAFKMYYFEYRTLSMAETPDNP